ncbi:hypothetical protein C7B65_20510 [Phormidesmis priestleyi ULC007]|uniref:Uncharacterized protein n=1 Tax=Phormidesmis priestleyi ULC007 TaxID=1920490 RepID=A0A2T1D8L9_9CYAN|nr:hypothetical protein [Phormidesmis priestleyi]PSB16845.1 hypothetical protein C7B65_20510 [Phormidesmis priestleyi ULC007]PZO47760.1 MAG: hypothetical protein DCF14_19045 [Phormidesmis priestleyi]
MSEQNQSGNSIQADIKGDTSGQIAVGRGISQTQINSTASVDKQLTQSDVVTVLGELDRMIRDAELPSDVKEELTLYLGAAKKAVEKEEPKKVLAADNLKTMAETLENAGKTVEAGKSLWDKVKPFLGQISGWLGVAKGFFWF